MGVVMLITQRSRVQIPPRYQGQRPFLEQRKGLLHVVCNRFVNVALVRAVSRARVSTVAAWSAHAEPESSNEVSDPLIRRLKTVPQANMLPNSP
jgi:hypothetical protein